MHEKRTSRPGFSNDITLRSESSKDSFYLEGIDARAVLYLPRLLLDPDLKSLLFEFLLRFAMHSTTMFIHAAIVMSVNYIIFPCKLSNAADLRPQGILRFRPP